MSLPRFWRVIVLLAIVAISLAILAIPPEQIELLQSFGYAGIFLLSVLANATIILPTPAFLVVFAMGEHLSPLLLGLAAGSGATIGELSGYLAGFTGQALIPNNPTYQRLESWVRKYGALTVFLLAALPNPVFDLAGIAAGVLKMPLWKFLLWCWCGKVVRMAAVAFAGAQLL